jgi:aromatic ring-opening dioxygenase catalytic subunit (LigB family)
MVWAPNLSSIASFRYPARPDSALGARVAAALVDAGLRDVTLATPKRGGLDHGAWLALEALAPSAHALTARWHAA